MFDQQSVKTISETVLKVRDNFFMEAKHPERNWIVSTEEVVPNDFGKPDQFSFLGAEKHTTRAMVHLDNGVFNSGTVKVAIYTPEHTHPFIGLINVDGAVQERFTIPGADEVLNVEHLSDLLDNLQTDLVTQITETDLYLDFLTIRGIFTTEKLEQVTDHDKLVENLIERQYAYIDKLNGLTDVVIEDEIQE